MHIGLSASCREDVKTGKQMNNPMNSGLFKAFAAVVVLTCSCTKEPSVVCDGAEEDDVRYVAEEGAVPGWIRIKLSEEGSRTLRTGCFTRGEMASGDSRLDAVAQELGATEIRRVFRDGGRFEARRRRYGLHLWYDIRIDEEVPVSRAQAEMAALPGVEVVEPIYRMRRLDAVAVPADAFYEPPVAMEGEGQLPFDDPMLAQQWHYHNDGSVNLAKAGADMNLFEGWKTTAGSREVIVAVTDAGVQYDHPDLAANMWVNEAELNGTPGVDDDGNGYVDDVYGWNFVRGNATIVGEDHGTHVAGTVAAVNNNGIGVCGVAGGTGHDDGARIMALQIFEGNESVGDTDAESFVYAADNGAVISQNSWTWTRLSALPRAYSVAFDYFIENAGMDDSDGDGGNDVQTGPMRGGIIICAAGNSGGRVEFPAADPRTVTVTAMGADYTLEAYSNRGPEADIMAPGGVKAANYKRKVWSTVAGSDYDAMYGTSMACPHVSGLAALIVAAYGGEGFTAEQCREILLRSYRPVGGLAADADLDVLGVGLLDAGAAFVADPQTPPAAAELGAVEVTGNEVKIALRVPADGNGNPVARFVAEYASADATPQKTEGANRREVGETMVASFQGRYNTDYEINVIAIDRFGNESEPVSGSFSIGGFENRPPVKTAERMPDFTLTGTQESDRLEVSLTPYFTDPDLEYGDELAYSAVSTNEEVVGVELRGDVMTLVPRTAGSSMLTVTATDLAGAAVSATVYAKVTAEAAPSDGTEGLAIESNPVAERLEIRLKGMEGVVNIRIYDGAARRVMAVAAEAADGRVALDVSGLSPGHYTLSAERNGTILRGTFVKR